MIDDVINNLRNEMGQTLEALRRELSRLRTGRASTGLLEGITVDH
jgi:ribosome recycling factor